MHPQAARPRDWMNAYRLLLLAVLVGLWYVLTSTEILPPFFFGEPLKIGLIVVQWVTSGKVLVHLGFTLIETFLSFAFGTALGVAAGLTLGLNEFVGRLLDPFVKAVNATPRVVFAPIFALWFGLGIWSKVALGTSLVFFVVFFNVFQGVRDVNLVVLANARMLGASSRQLLRSVYLPSATSWVFSSLHNAVGMAFVGAVVGEYLGSAAGIGFLILQAEGAFDVNSVYAGIVVLTICALVLDVAVSSIEHRLLAWRPKTAETERAQA
jgi:NitT/TauT family transport system permease protein